MKLRIGLSLLLLGVLVFIVSKAVNINELPRLIWEFPHLVLLELIALSLIISILKSWRFLILLRNSKIKISFWEAIKTSVAGSAVTPLPGGEAIRGVLLKKTHNVSSLKSTAPIIIQAYLELLAASFIFALGSLFFDHLIIPALFFLVLVSSLAILFTNERLLIFLLSKTKKVPFLPKFLKRLHFAHHEIKNTFYDSDSKLPDKILVRTFGISLLTNLLGGIIIFMIAKAYNVNLDPLTSIFIYSGGQIIQGIGTISPGGIGLTEGGLAGLLLLSKVEINKALAIVLIFRAITFLFNIMIGLLFLGLFYSKHLMHKK